MVDPSCPLPAARCRSWPILSDESELEPDESVPKRLREGTLSPNFFTTSQFSGLETPTDNIPSPFSDLLRLPSPLGYRTSLGIPYHTAIRPPIVRHQPSGHSSIGSRGRRQHRRESDKQVSGRPWSVAISKSWLRVAARGWSSLVNF